MKSIRNIKQQTLVQSTFFRLLFGPLAASFALVAAEINLLSLYLFTATVGQ